MTAALLAFLIAHESSVSSSRLEFRDREIRAAFTFSLEDLAGLARLDLDRNGTVDRDEWRRVLPAVVDYVGARFRIENGGEPCRSEGDPELSLPAMSLSDGRAPVVLELRYRSSRPLDRVSLRCDLFTEHGGNPRHIAELTGGRLLVFDRSRTQADGVQATPTARAGFPVPAAVAVAAALLMGAAALRKRTRSRNDEFRL